jgi:hypothetical protein
MIRNSIINGIYKQVEKEPESGIKRIFIQKCRQVRQAPEGRAERMKQWIGYYNGERLHAAFYYLPSDDVSSDMMGIRVAERREKPYTASINRRSYWQVQAAEL